MAKTQAPAEADAPTEVDVAEDPVAEHPFTRDSDSFRTRATAYVLEPIAVALARTPDAGTASNSDIKGALRSVQETIRRMLAGPDAVPTPVDIPVEDPDAVAKASLQPGSSTPQFPEG